MHLSLIEVRKENYWLEEVERLVLIGAGPSLPLLSECGEDTARLGFGHFVARTPKLLGDGKADVGAALTESEESSRRERLSIGLFLLKVELGPQHLELFDGGVCGPWDPSTSSAR